MKNTIFVALFCILTLSLVMISAQENTTVNETEVVSNETPETEPIMVEKILLVNFLPKDVKVGDVQFNVQVQNTGTETLEDVVAIITGKGFSTYDIAPISLLAPGDKDYIFASGNLREAGNINLTIRINNQVFYKEISVIDPNSGSQSQLDSIEKAQEKEQLIKNISEKLNTLKEDFAKLEEELMSKAENDYDVSWVNLNDLKGYLKKIQTDVSTGNAEDAKLNLDFALEEYSVQKEKLDNVKKTSLVSRMKNYVVIFTTFAGAILTFFTLYELLKKKNQSLKEVSKKILSKKEEEPQKKSKKK